MYELLKGKFNYCKDIHWNDVIDKIGNEFESQTQRFIFDGKAAPTFVLTNSYFPGSIKNIFEEVNKVMKTKSLHIYTSLGMGSATYGRHSDTMDVLLIQSIGNVSYIIDDGCGDYKTVNLTPGDGLIIKKGIYHNPLIKEARVTLSFSWD